MSDYATKLPPVGTCSSCGSQIRVVPRAHKRTSLVVNARSNLKGTVWVRDSPAGPVCQELTEDTRSGFVSARIPLYLPHRETCAAKATKRRAA